MLGRTDRRRWRRRAGAVRRRAEALTVGTVGVLALTLAAASTAAAQVVRDPTGSVAVATAGETADGRYVAVSNGGSATGTMLALSHGGAATSNCSTIEFGVCQPGLGFSTTGPGSGYYLGLSGTGTGNGYVGGSGTGTGRGNVGLSGTGLADGHFAAVSGTGTADAALAVSGTGNATASNTPVAFGVSQPGVAVSGGGTANGGTAGVTVWGESSGGTASVDPDRTVGTARDTASQPVENTGLYRNWGVTEAPSAYQAWLSATTPPPDPAAVARKLADYADAYPQVVQLMATGLPGPRPSSPEDYPSSASAASSSDTVPMFDFEFNEGATQTQIGDDGCTPNAVHAAYVDHGSPGQRRLYDDMRTSETDGAPFTTGADVMRRYYQGSYPPAAYYVDSMDTLLTLVVVAITRHQQGMVLDVSPNSLWSDQPVGHHAVTVWGYDFYAGDPMTSMHGGVYVGTGGAGQPGGVFPISQLYYALTMSNYSNVIW